MLRIFTDYFLVWSKVDFLFKKKKFTGQHIIYQLFVAYFYPLFLFGFFLCACCIDPTMH